MNKSPVIEQWKDQAEDLYTLKGSIIECLEVFQMKHVTVRFAFISVAVTTTFVTGSAVRQ